jgi:hypothetical protein
MTIHAIGFAAPITAAIEHAARAHAVLSASSSSMWLNCTPSARLNDAAPERGDKTAANKGTLCHESTESALRMFLGIISVQDHKENTASTHANPLWDSEMTAAVATAFEYGRTQIDAAWAEFGKDNVVIKLEERVDFSRWVPEGFGSADLVIITPAYIKVIDWKFGIGKVWADGNPQMRLYGAGTYDTYGMLFGSPVVEMVIVQPFLDAVESETMDTDVLMAWMDDYVQPRAALAWAGTGDFNPTAKGCQWCKVRSECRARAEQQLAVAGDAFTLPALLVDDELAAIFLKIKGLRAWANDIEEHVIDLVVDKKHTVAGLKIVEGKSNRFISNMTQAKAKLREAGYPDDAVMAPVPTERQLLGLTALEKSIGKKKFTEMMAGIVVKPVGKPEVVSIDDPREAMQVSSTSSPEEDFQ